MRSTCTRFLHRLVLQVWRKPKQQLLDSSHRLPPRRGAATWVPSATSTLFDGEAHDFSYTDLPLDERRLLGRARLHNIFSRENLLLEADVGNTQNVGTKLTDKPTYRQDLELWKLILDVNSYHKGINGVKQTWNGMRNRGTQVQLPPENPTAVELWESIINAAATEDVNFLWEVCWHCSEKGILQSRVFPDVLGTLLRYQPSRAWEFAKVFRYTHRLGHEEMLTLFRIACDSPDRSTLQTFRAVHALFPDLKLYPDFVPYLCKLERIDDALAMHNYLLVRQDLPRSFEDLAPFVRHFACTEAMMNPFLHNLRAAGISFEAQIHRLYARERARLVGFHPETMNILAGHTFLGEPKNIKDHTIARAIATPGFSFDFVIRFLQPFGLIEFGPLAVRQMALQSANVGELNSKFDKLREFNIDLGSSMYVRTMKKLSGAGDADLTAILARTDMHHEEFEDASLQRSLMSRYLKKRDLAQMRRSLAILHVGDTSSRTHASAADLLARSAVHSENWTAVLQAVNLCRLHKQRVSKPVMLVLSRKLLYMAKKGREIGTTDMDHVGFLAGVLQQLLISGNVAQPKYWIEILLELGNAGRLDELDHLTLWLAEHYSTMKAEVPYKQDAWSIDTELSNLFRSRLLRLMISWSFTKHAWKIPNYNSGLQSPPSENEPWLRGAAVVKTLRDKFGVPVDVPDLQTLFLLRVRDLYRVKLWSRLSANRSWALRAGVKPTDYLGSWSKLWGIEVSKQQQAAFHRSLPTTHELCRRKRVRTRSKGSTEAEALLAGIV